MSSNAQRAALAALCLIAGTAQAAAKCKLTGHWSDKYGATAVIKGLKGTGAFGKTCTTYTLAISDLTKLGFDVSASSTNKLCPAFSAALTFAAGSCTVATGSITYDGLKLSDTWTNAGKLRAPAVATSKLTDGLR